MKAQLRLADESAKRRPIKRRLTGAMVRNAPAPATGRTILYDASTPGLALVVSASGHRAYYLIRKMNGRARRIRLADGDLAIEHVRKLATKTSADANAGIDPVAERRKARAKVSTLDELWTVYKEDRDRTPRTVTAEASLWKAAKSFHARRIDSITPEEVAALHARIGKERGRITANRIVQILRRLYRFAKRRRLYTADNPAEGIEFYKEQSRERYVKPSELPRLLAAIDAESEPWPDYFRLLLLTGSRRSALAAMRWADVDLDAGTWTIPAEHSKNKQSLTVPLVAEAVERLKRRRTEAPADAVNVFASWGKTGHRINPWEAFDRIRTAANLTDVTIHDLRRTCGSYLAAAGVPLPIIGRALGHRSQQSTQIYARLDVTEVRRELAHVADAMNHASKPKPSRKRKAAKHEK